MPQVLILRPGIRVSHPHKPNSQEGAGNSHSPRRNEVRSCQGTTFSRAEKGPKKVMGFNP